MAARSQTPYVARVERVLIGKVGRSVLVACPFLCGHGVHEHPWPKSEPRPSRGVLAPCARPGELLTYGIDPVSAVEGLDAVNGRGRKR